MAAVVTPQRSASPASAPHSVPLRDPLTGLETQPALRKRLLRHFAANNGGRPVTLALFQLANFYEIRSWVGPAEADLLLSAVAGKLLTTLPRGATLFRCQHYEFAMLLEQECSYRASHITPRIQLALQAAAKEHIPPQLNLNCVVGLARQTPDIKNPDILFARARHSLGQNQQCTRLPVSGEASPPLSLAALKAALKVRGLKLTFQPLLHWRDSSMHWYEVRSSLRHGEACWSGQQLFDTAVRNALGETLDRLVLEQALTLLERCSDKSVQLLVNLSLNSLVSQNFLGWLEQCLSRHGILPQRLCLQISEIDVLIAQHHACPFSLGVARLGIPLCIRHFGCFDDPLGYLSLLKVRWVKLDGALTQGLLSGNSPPERVNKLVTALASKGIGAMAGTLDDLALLPLLWRSGVTAVQGNCLQPAGCRPDFHFPEERVLQ